jgi:phosphoribosylamine--glycine ligase
MLTADGPRVLEFNCRFGDPETQALVPLLEGDLLGALDAAATGRLEAIQLDTAPGAAVTVVLASAGYPDAPQSGVEIRGIAAAEETGALVFHSGTALQDGAIVSAGGRVLAVTATGPTPSEARDRAYNAVDVIDFPGCQYRRDIALRSVRVAG